MTGPPEAVSIFSSLASLKPVNEPFSASMGPFWLNFLNLVRL
jgi:hypothetical protein